jgi:phosphatidylglycerol:prolipoprotein diacylglycerol transferase
MQEEECGMIRFPGLGLNFNFSPIAFNLFGRDIYWYGFIVSAAILAGCWLAVHRAKRAGLDGDKTIDALFCTVFAALIGARVYYVIFKGGYSFMDFLRVWEGGVAIYGALIGGAIGLLVYCKATKVSFWEIADVFAPAVLLGQAIGRWGNFTNREAYGAMTDSFLRMELGHLGYAVHPTFLYESLWCLLGVFILSKFAKKDALWWFAAWYGAGRMFIEGLRADSLMIGDIRVSQLVAVVSLIAAITMIIYNKIRAKKGSATS